MVLDPPILDLERMRARPDVKVLQGPETRTIASSRQRPTTSAEQRREGQKPVPGHRVRRRCTRQSTWMRSPPASCAAATPAALLVAPGVRGYDKSLDVRLPYDPAKAKALLQEAGYPDGFGFTFDCTNNRYPGDEEMCTASRRCGRGSACARRSTRCRCRPSSPKSNAARAVCSCLARRRRRSMRITASRFRCCRQAAGRVTGLGISAATRTRQSTTSPCKSAGELDEAKRTKLMQQAMTLARDDIATLPLFYNQIAWAARSNIEVSLRADNQMEAKWVVVK